MVNSRRFDNYLYALILGGYCVVIIDKDIPAVNQRYHNWLLYSDQLGSGVETLQDFVRIYVKKRRIEWQIQRGGKYMGKKECFIRKLQNFSVYNF